MKKIISLITLALFFTWILPLGVFIKKTEEKVSCGGKRAVHMCTMSFEESTADNNIKIMNNSNINSKKNSSSGSSNDYLLKRINVPKTGHKKLFINKNLSFKEFILTSKIEHVPKIF